MWVWAEKFKEDLDSLHLPRRVRSTLSRLASIEWVEETRSDEGQYVEIAVRALDKPYPCYQGALQYSETLKMEDFNFRTWVEWMVSSQEAMIQILAVYEVGEKTFAALKLAGEKFLSET